MIKDLEKGQSIIEVLVALAVGVLVVSAITIAGLNALNNAQYGRDQTLATKYAQEGIEVAKNLSKADLSAFKTFGSTGTSLCYCISDHDVKSATFSAYPECQASSVTTCCSLHCGRTLSDSSITPNTNCDSNGNCKIIRQVKVKQDASFSGECGTSNLAEATVSAYWTDSKCSSTNPYCHRVEATSCIDTEAVPAP